MALSNQPISLRYISINKKDDKNSKTNEREKIRTKQNHSGASTSISDNTKVVDKITGIYYNTARSDGSGSIRIIMRAPRIFPITTGRRLLDLPTLKAEDNTHSLNI